MRLITRLKFVNSINLFLFLYYNYFCKSVQRHGKGKIIPYKNAIINIDKTANIILNDGDIEIGTEKLKKSKAETYIRLRENSSWSSNGGCKIAFGSTIELLKNSRFNSGYFTMSSNSTVITGQSVTFGNDVMLARNVVVFDSDFHEIKCSEHNIDIAKPVVIGSHVWIGVNSVVLKGVTVADGCMVAANTVVTKESIPNSIIGNDHCQKILEKDILWKR